MCLETLGSLDPPTMKIFLKKAEILIHTNYVLRDIYILKKLKDLPQNIPLCGLSNLYDHINVISINLIFKKIPFKVLVRRPPRTQAIHPKDS